jgi:hypothetical protein
MNHRRADDISFDRVPLTKVLGPGGRKHLVTVRTFGRDVNIRYVRVGTLDKPGALKPSGWARIGTVAPCP